MAAICCVLRTGGHWTARHDTGRCASRAAHRRGQEWAAADVFLARWRPGLTADEAVQGLDGAWLARDGAMTNAPLGGQQVGTHPTDRGMLGPQRSVLTAGGGVPMGSAVAGAPRHDFKRVRETLTSSPVARPTPPPEPPQGRGLDHGDADDAVRERRAECGFTAHIRGRGEEARALTQEAGCKARRWVGERTPRGMHRCRRVLMRWDTNVRHDVAVVHVAWASMTSRQAGLLG